MWQLGEKKYFIFFYKMERADVSTGAEDRICLCLPVDIRRAVIMCTVLNMCPACEKPNPPLSEHAPTNEIYISCTRVSGRAAHILGIRTCTKECFQKIMGEFSEKYRSVIVMGDAKAETDNTECQLRTLLKYVVNKTACAECHTEMEKFTWCTKCDRQVLCEKCVGNHTCPFPHPPYVRCCATCMSEEYFQWIVRTSLGKCAIDECAEPPTNQLNVTKLCPTTGGHVHVIKYCKAHYEKEKHQMK